MVQESAFDVAVEKYTGTAEPFKPGERKEVKFELIPTVPEVPAPFAPFAPEFIPTEYKPLVLDIESTGTLPWETKIICIGVKDPSRPAEPPLVFMDTDEQKMLTDFFSYFQLGGYNQLVGYNLSFDFRYLFVKALHYRITCKEFTEAKLCDLMQVMKQAKEAFVFGYNKTGKLEDWSYFLFGIKKPMSITEMLSAYALKRFDEVRAYNSNDVEITTMLYNLVEYVVKTGYTGMPFGAPPVLSSPNGIVKASLANNIPISNTLTNQTKIVKCKNCLAEVTVSASETYNICPICKQKL